MRYKILHLPTAEYLFKLNSAFTDALYTKKEVLKRKKYNNFSNVFESKKEVEKFIAYNLDDIIHFDFDDTYCNVSLLREHLEIIKVDDV